MSVGDTKISSSVQDAVNARVYHAAGIERAYRSRALDVAETMALLKYQAAFAQRDVLDIGVGTGRTSAYLAPLARRYEAIDYSPAMVRHLRLAMPSLSVRLADMRSMPDFPDGCFDFILAPNNVFDAVGHEDRFVVLQEMRRLVRPGGVLMFSSHNLDYRHALEGPRLLMSRNPLIQVRNIVRWLRQMGNHARVGRLRRHQPGYALLDDPGHDYACLHYYIGQMHQRRQLADAGFAVLDVFDKEGRAIAAQESALDSSSLLYVARRADPH